MYNQSALWLSLQGFRTEPSMPPKDQNLVNWMKEIYPFEGKKRHHLKDEKYIQNENLEFERE